MRSGLSFIVTRASIVALALGLAACAPTEDDLVGSITDEYEGRGATDIDVVLEPTDDGGYTGHVEFVDPGSGETTRQECTVDPPEGSEARWECAPA